MQVPPELNEQWRNHARNNPGRSYGNAEIAALNRKFRAQKENADRQAALERRDLELYQRKWEELSGGYTQAPEYIRSWGSPDTGLRGNEAESFLKTRAEEIKRHQNIMSKNQQQQQAQSSITGFADPNWRNNASPQMQNPFQF